MVRIIDLKPEVASQELFGLGKVNLTSLFLAVLVYKMRVRQ